jgi:hypothetical protein
MNDHYLRFKSFPDKETAEDFAEVLKGKDVSYFVEVDELVFDPSYANNPLNKEYVLKVRQADFDKAHKAYNEYFEDKVDHVSDDYYLFSFTDDELREIVARPDEWGSFDYQLALKLLKEKGVPVSEEQKEQLKNERVKALAKQDGEPVSNIVGYYVLCVLFFPIGFLIGWIWAYSKKTLPNGAIIHTYNNKVRQHGRIILAMACIFLFLTVLRLVL